MLNTEEYRKLLRSCYDIATASPDPSTQNGAIVLNNATSIIGIGYNVFPAGVSTDEEDRWERPKKYSFIEHAERNALFNAARNNLITPKMTLVCPWAACADCARTMIALGVNHLVTHKSMHDLPALRWSESIGYAFEMLSEAGVTVTFIDGDLNAPPIRVNGELLTL